MEPSQLILGVWGLHPASPLVSAYHSFIRSLLLRILHWFIASWQLRMTVTQDQKMQRKLLDAVEEEGLKN